jgi:hypothetical protein
MGIKLVVSLQFLSSSWFFIGYWILKTGLDFYPGPFFILRVFREIKTNNSGFSLADQFA